MTWQPAVLINLDCALDKMRMRTRMWTRMKTKTNEMLTKSLVKEDEDEHKD